MQINIFLNTFSGLLLFHIYQQNLLHIKKILVCANQQTPLPLQKNKQDSLSKTGIMLMKIFKQLQLKKSIYESKNI